MAADAFAPTFFAADCPLVGGLPPATGLPDTVNALAANIEGELARRSGRTDEAGTVNERTNDNRGQRVASRFLSEASAAFTRNRPVLEALRERYRLGIVSNFYGNLEAVCHSAGLAPLFAVMVDSHRVGAEKPDPAIFRAALEMLRATPETTMFVGDSLRRDREGARRSGHALHLDCAPRCPDCRSSCVGGAACSCYGDRAARSHEDLEMTGISTAPIQGGIIAAGDGSRLRADGYRVSKPMVPVAGRPLIDLALNRFRAVGIRRLTIIINDASDDCRQWLRDHGGDLDLDMIVRTTRSSYASFQLVVGRLADAPAVITTIDVRYAGQRFSHFCEICHRPREKCSGARPDRSCRRRKSAVGHIGRHRRSRSAARRQ